MTAANSKTVKLNPRTERQNEAMRTELMEMHLLDLEAVEEKPLYGENSSPNELMGVAYYLEMRKYDFGVGTVCERCKALATPFAVHISLWQNLFIGGVN